MATVAVNIPTEKVIITTLNSAAISNTYDCSSISPSNHEEADTRMFLHARDAGNRGMRSVSIRTVDTDVVAIAVGSFFQLSLDQLWISFGVGKNHRNIPIHSIFEVLGEKKSCCVPLFHAITGCDQVSFFNGRGKKNAWNTWTKFDDFTEVLSLLVTNPSKEALESSFRTIERFIVLLYDRTSQNISVDETRKYLFASKGRSIEGIPPSRDALYEHLKRAVYQGCFCWGQSLISIQALPSPTEWGWKLEREKYCVNWTTLPEASQICKELVRCNCKKEKGCSGRCTCRKASLKCTELCKCGGDCES